MCNKDTWIRGNPIGVKALQSDASRPKVLKRWLIGDNFDWHLEIESGPNDIEKWKENKADIFQELSAPVEEKLEHLQKIIW